MLVGEWRRVLGDARDLRVRAHEEDVECDGEVEARADLGTKIPPCGVQRKPGTEPRPVSLSFGCVGSYTYPPPNAMDVAFSLPEDLARRLQDQWGDLSRGALESVAAQAYRDESLTLGEVRALLGHETRMETEAFLKERGALLDYSEEELERDLEVALQAAEK